MKSFRVRHFFKALRLLGHDKKILSGEGNSVKQGTLLIVKMDAIGDYLLFRNFLEDIRKSKKFAAYQITLCGNVIWKEIAESFDANFVNEFIWIDKKKLVDNLEYRAEKLKSIRRRGFEIAFQPTFSRELLTGDSIIRASSASSRIGSKGDDASELEILKNIGDTYYSKLSVANSSVVFEFEKNKRIIEELTEEKISRYKPEIKNYSDVSSGEKYAVLFPGAGEAQKQWPFKGFAAISEELSNKYKLKIRICGSAADSILADQIISECKTSAPVNLCGKTNLQELLNEIAHAEFLFTNDSSALHIAASANTKTVCVLSGRHYSRFSPYPENSCTSLEFVFPDKMDKIISEDKIAAVQKTKYNAVDSIDSISIEKVKKVIGKILS